MTATAEDPTALVAGRSTRERPPLRRRPPIREGDPVRYVGRDPDECGGDLGIGVAGPAGPIGRVAVFPATIGPLWCTDNELAVDTTTAEDRLPPAVRRPE